MTHAALASHLALLSVDFLIFFFFFFFGGGGGRDSRARSRLFLDRLDGLTENLKTISFAGDEINFDLPLIC